MRPEKESSPSVEIRNVRVNHLDDTCADKTNAAVEAADKDPLPTVNILEEEEMPFEDEQCLITQESN